MEYDILDQLYFGRIVPWEIQNDQTPEIKKINNQLYKDIEHLEKLLDDDGRKILERIQENNAERQRYSVCEEFKEGFRLGIQLMAAGIYGGKKR